MAKNRICRVCYQPFSGRRDARTCSPRCRKRLQRTREELTGASQAVNYYTEPSKKAGSSGLVARALSAGKIRNLLVIAITTLVVVLAGPTSVVLAEISQGYLTQDTALSQHMAVALTGEKMNGQPLVRASDSNEPSSALGVAVSLTDSLLAVSSVSKAVYVANNGPVEVYVSDVNGEPKVGDLLAVSPLKGVLVKSVDKSKPTFGIALENFDSQDSQSTEIQAKNGQTLQTNISIMSVNVDVSPPQEVDPGTKDDWLQSVAANITGRDLSSVRVIAILMVFITMMIVAGEIIYSVVSGSITALGRNPLAKKFILRQSFRNIGFAAMVLLVGSAIIVLLIWI